MYIISQMSAISKLEFVLLVFLLGESLHVLENLKLYSSVTVFHSVLCESQPVLIAWFVFLNFFTISLLLSIYVVPCVGLGGWECSSFMRFPEHSLILD